MLIPSTRHALRTRKYMSTMYILVTFHQSLDRLYRKVAGGTVFDRHAQAVEPPSRYIIAPPFYTLPQSALGSLFSRENPETRPHRIAV